MRVPILQPTTSTPSLASVFEDPRRILRHCLVFGAVILRGFPDAGDMFGSVIKHCDFDHIGSAAPRTRVSEGVFTANDAPPDAVIPFHHELSQSLERPTHLMFHAVVPPSPGCGGETVLVDSRSISKFVQRQWPAVAHDLDDGIVYRRTMPETTDASSPIGRSWRDTLGVYTRVEAERVLAHQCMSWRWTEAGLWTQSRTLPAFRHHPVNGELSFCNSLIAAHTGWNDDRNNGSTSVLFAKNERPLPVDFVRDVQQFAWEHRFECKWNTNDVLVVDNTNTMHARNAYSGRRTLHVRMIKTSHVRQHSV